MNIEYANAIPLRLFFEKIGSKPLQKTDGHLYFLSPFRDDRRPDLVVNTATNTWGDRISQTSGNMVDLVCLYLKYHKEDDTIHDSLRWLKNMVGYPVLLSPEGVVDYSALDKSYKFKDAYPLTDYMLIKYLEEEKGIPCSVASTALCEIDILNKTTRKTFTALALKNENGGYAAFNRYIKAQVGLPDISFIRGKTIKPSGIHIFKDVMDYLSVLAKRQGEPFTDDVMVLNSLLNMPGSAAYIRGYGYTKVHTWLDNSVIGNKATENYQAFFRTEPDLDHIRMNEHYKGHKDVSAWHIAHLEIA